MIPPREYIRQKGIKYSLAGKDEARFPCPVCNEDEGFSFNLESGFWCCLRASCQSKGNYHSFKVALGEAYDVPERKQPIERPDELAVALEAAFDGGHIPEDPIECWMLSLRNAADAKEARQYLYWKRCLTHDVLQRAQIGWMADRFNGGAQSNPLARPGAKQARSNGWITIPYPIPKDYGQQGLVKLRAVPPEQYDKKGRPIRYRRIPGAKTSLYTPFGVTGEKPLLLIGGEIDVLSVMQAYLDAGVECPYDLASPTSESSFSSMGDEIDQRGQDIIIAFDNDAAGVVAAEKAATIIGRWRCRFAKWEEVKDANAALQAGRLNPDIVEAMVGKSKPAVGQKVQPTDSYADRVIAALRRPGAEGWSTGLPTLDAYLGGGLHPGKTTVITGHTNAGKSIISSQIALTFAKRLQRVFFCPFELGVDDQITRSVQQWSERDPRKMTDAEVREHIRAIGDMIYWFDHYGEIELDVFIETITYVTRRLDVSLCVFDNRNFMIRRDDTQYYQKMAELGRRIVQVFRRTDVHALLVIHPSKPPSGAKDRDDWIPQLADAKGGSDIYQDIDNFLSMYRPRTSDREDERDENGLYPAGCTVMKARDTRGKEGTVELLYDTDLLTFYDVAAMNMFDKRDLG